ncbi:MAG: site-specific DNA-methyltransferase [Negativicutes bacterium]|nr:site-specific DNA-methyltransferase [Negativicutes bacterium]
MDKGRWDRSRGAELNHQFNLEWLSRCQRLLTADGTIWVSGTQHVIHSVGFAMQQLGMKLLNDIVWEKPNPPPNLSCRYFAHSAETLIWAGRNKQTKHLFNYRLMKEINGGKQMKSVWRIAAPRPQEKAFGRHPTQKPVELLERIILASSREQDWVFDPFAGSATTGVAAVRCGRRFVGCELDGKAVELSRQRLQAEIATGYGGTAVG